MKNKIYNFKDFERITKIKNDDGKKQEILRFYYSNVRYFFIFFTVLKAISEDSPTVPTLLTDYILKGK